MKLQLGTYRLLLVRRLQLLHMYLVFLMLLVVKIGKRVTMLRKLIDIHNLKVLWHLKAIQKT